MADRCNGSWFGGHKFEPRYDDIADRKEVTPEQISTLNDALMYSDDIVRAIGKLAGGGKRYVHDVCVRCGEVAARRTSADVGGSKQP